jgi:hypothetical protein
MLGEHDLVGLVLRLRVVAPGARRLDVTARDQEFRGGNGLAGLGILCSLLGGGLALQEGLAAAIDLTAQGMHRLGLLDVRLRDLNGGLGTGQLGAALGDTGLLLGRVDRGQDLAGRDDVAVISAQVGDGAGDLEADPAQHTGLDGTETEDRDRHVGLRLQHRDCQRTQFDKRDRGCADDHAGRDDGRDLEGLAHVPVFPVVTMTCGK